MSIEERIISLERSALDCWVNGNPDGYLRLYATNASYFDPFLDRRVDGLEKLNEIMAAMRGVELPFTDPRYDMINPVVVVAGNLSVLTFNLVNYGKLSGGGDETVLARWNATEVYEQIDGEWQIIHSHWSFTQPQLTGPPGI